MLIEKKLSHLHYFIQAQRNENKNDWRKKKTTITAGNLHGCSIKTRLK